MKKNLLFISLALLMVVFACKKDDPSPYDAKYTTETPAESKANVEDNAIALVDHLDDMTSATAIEVLTNLSDLESGSSTLKSTATNPVIKPILLISTLSKRENISAVFAELKSSGELLVEDPLNFSESFESMAGKYVYNNQTGVFDESELADKVVFEFPGKETDNTNTAVLTISDFSVVEITDPMEEWPTELDNELPAGIKIDLKYNGTSIAGASFAASYKNTGMPTKVTVELTMDDFTFTMAAVHSPYSSASWRNTLKFQSDILFETYIAASGNWSEENIDENVIETEYTDDWGTWTETETHIEEIINKANAHVIMMNLKIVGTVNAKVLGDAIWAIDEQEEEMTEEYAQAVVDAINANAKLVVIYRDSNTKVAIAEAYVESEYDSYYEATEYYPAMRFVYADGSKVDVETYVNSELDNFYVSVNDFIDKLNMEYDLNMDYVGPVR